MNFQSTVSTSGNPPRLSDGLQDLLQQLCAKSYQSHRLVRLSVIVANEPLLALLSSLSGVERQFFSLRDQSLSLAGLGHSVRLLASNALQIQQVMDQAQQMVVGTECLWVGGCSFAGNNGAGQWQDFPAAMFSLPLVEIRETLNQQILAVNLYAESYAQWQSKLDEIAAITEKLRAPRLLNNAGTVVNRRDTTTTRVWNGLVLNALNKIDSEPLKKVVLAREIELLYQGSPDPFSALASIDRSDNPGYLFAIESAASLFFGCSPERLFRVEGRRLATEALAGTVRRGDTSSEDMELENRLIQSRKLVREHRLVADAIRNALQALATNISQSAEVGVVKLSHIQHSYQKISATLLPEVTAAQLFAKLHPTPAICGFPAADAKMFIRDHERFQRGWYSGAVGVIGSHTAELSVAIRSGLSKGARLWLYSGVGIVRGSNPATEWQELESKLQSLLQALGTPTEHTAESHGVK